MVVVAYFNVWHPKLVKIILFKRKNCQSQCSDGMGNYFLNSGLG
jgi:hypothetical protein